MITLEILNERKNVLYIKSILGIILIILASASLVQIVRAMISMQKDIDFLYESLSKIADHQVLLSNVFIIDKDISKEATDISDEQKMKSRRDSIKILESIEKKKNQKHPTKH